MPEEPEKAINLLWRVDEIIIALQQLRERLRRLAAAGWTATQTEDALLKMKLTAPQGRRRAALALRPHCLLDHGPRRGGNARCRDRSERDQ